MIADERLELVFACCHPALATEAQVALTLRTLGGLTADEIARAFLVSPETMKRRLSRARAKIRVAGIPFAVPQAERLPERLAAVLAVIYLIFNEGYGGRGDLATEAVRLGRVLAELLPAEPEVAALLALMCLHDSRRDARFADGEIVRLADQDRSRWDPARIAAGRAALARARALADGPGPYRLQAEIAAEQLQPAPDWSQIAGALRRARGADRLTGRAAQPRRRRRAGGRARRRAGDRGCAGRSTATATSIPPGPSCWPAWVATARRATPYDRALALVVDDRERRFLERRRDALPGA